MARHDNRSSTTRQNCPLLVRKVIATLVWYQLLVSGKNNCQSCLEKVVLMHLIVWLIVGKGLLRKATKSDYLSPLSH